MQKKRYYKKALTKSPDYYIKLRQREKKRTKHTSQRSKLFKFLFPWLAKEK